jgi:hypothetical protein
MAWYIIFAKTRHISIDVKGPGASMSSWSFNFTFRYIDDVISLNNFRFGDFVDRIYPIELEIKHTTDTDRSASYLYLHLKIDS